MTTKITNNKNINTLKRLNKKSPSPSKDLKNTLKEVEAFEKGKIKSKGYHNVKKMFEETKK